MIEARQAPLRTVSCAEARDLLKDGWVLLDVRPPHEVANASVKGAVHVPLFSIDEGTDPLSLLRQASAFGTAGWWVGQSGRHHSPNLTFMADVAQQVQDGAKVLVCCQDGYRSLSAASRLAQEGRVSEVRCLPSH